MNDQPIWLVDLAGVPWQIGVLLLFSAEVSIITRLLRLRLKKPSIILVTCFFWILSTMSNFNDVVFSKRPSSSLYEIAIEVIFSGFMILSIIGTWQVKKWGFVGLAVAIFLGTVVPVSLTYRDLLLPIIFVPIASGVWKYIEIKRPSPKHRLDQSDT